MSLPPLARRSAGKNDRSPSGGEVCFGRYTPPQPRSALLQQLAPSSRGMLCRRGDPPRRGTPPPTLGEAPRAPPRPPPAEPPAAAARPHRPSAFWGASKGRAGGGKSQIPEGNEMSAGGGDARWAPPFPPPCPRGRRGSTGGVPGRGALRRGRRAPQDPSPCAPGAAPAAPPGTLRGGGGSAST